MVDALVRYIHFIGIFAAFAALVCEHLLLQKELPIGSLKRILVVDAVYGIAALLLVTGGLLLWFVVGKDATFYTSNPLFHIKVTLVVLVALLSIYPTLYFRKANRSGANVILVPTGVIMVIRLELTLMLIIPLLAVLMAQGIGLG